MAPLATVGILSIGEMGMGIAKLLIAHNYRVVTNVEGRRWVNLNLHTLVISTISQL
jgi:3-hydroxyacyl-CoA dehydrogenase